jgi:hypothetical protein
LSPCGITDTLAAMGKRKKQPSKQKNPAVPKRSKNHKTTTNPWEAEQADETYEVEKVLASKFSFGVRHFEVNWVGYTETTWEPLANLVGAVSLIKEFEDARKQADSDAKAEVLALKVAR